MRKSVLILAAGMLMSLQMVGATEKTERKSISYVPVTALITDTVKVPAKVRPVFANQIIKVFKEMGRWDHNQLPAAVLKKYKSKAGSNFSSQSAMKRVIEETIVVEVSKILQANVLERAAELQDEADRKKFISEKAKELGIEASDIKQIMNSAFVGVPFISGFKSAQENNVLTYKVTGGMAWYNITSSDGVTKVVYLAEVHHDHSASSKTTKMVYDKKTKKSRPVKRNMDKVRAEVMRKCSKRIAERVRERTKNLTPFQLKTGITGVDGGTISFPLGSGQDVKLDDKYFLAEYRLDDRGQQQRHNVGFARVSSVGDGTPNNPSQAKIIRSSAVVSQGVSLIEHPRSGIEFRGAARMKQIKFNPGRLVGEDGREYFSYGGTPDLSLYLINIGSSYNTAGDTKVSQLYLNLDFMASLHKLSNATTLNSSYSAGGSLILGGTISMTKKIYMGAFAVGLEAGIGAIAWMSFTNYKDSAAIGIAQVSYSEAAFAGIVGGSLEYAATIDLNIGVSATYWISKPVSDWSLSVRNPGQEEGTDLKLQNSDLPELDISGLEARVFVNYAIL